MEYRNLNSPGKGHGVNGANNSNWRPTRARKRNKGEAQRAVTFWDRWARHIELTRAAQAAAKANCR